MDMEPIQMIAMRMNRKVKPGEMWFKLPHISAFVNDKVAIVFVVNKDNEPVSIVDDPDLFPSDMLITQLRLLNQ